jgi:hypothetical protein
MRFAAHRMHGDHIAAVGRMRDMRLTSSAISAPKKPTIAAVVALLLVSATAHAQLGSPTSTSSLGLPGNALTVGGTGIPIGATQLPDRGLSPAPLGTLGVAPVGSSSMPNTMSSTTRITGGATVLGNGLSSSVSSQGSFAPASPSFGITNFGTRGVQSLPGSPRSGATGNDR